jgi:hypothetical protein
MHLPTIVESWNLLFGNRNYIDVAYKPIEKCTERADAQKTTFPDPKYVCQALSSDCIVCTSAQTFILFYFTSHHLKNYICSLFKSPFRNIVAPLLCKNKHNVKIFQNRTTITTVIGRAFYMICKTYKAGYVMSTWKYLVNNVVYYQNWKTLILRIICNKSTVILLW